MTAQSRQFVKSLVDCPADELLSDFDVICNISYSINIYQAESPSLNIIEKLSRTDKHLTIL